MNKYNINRYYREHDLLQIYFLDLGLVQDAYSTVILTQGTLRCWLFLLRFLFFFVCLPLTTFGLVIRVILSVSPF